MDRDAAALERYKRKVRGMTMEELRRERSRVGSIRRNPINKARMIEAKVAGEPAAEQPRVIESPTKISDLMSVLEASVAAAREARSQRASGAAEEPAAKATAKPAKATSRASKAAAAESTSADEAKPKTERRRKVA